MKRVRKREEEREKEEREIEYEVCNTMHAIEEEQSKYNGTAITSQHSTAQQSL